MSVRHLLTFFAIGIFFLFILLPTGSEARGLLTCGGCNADLDPATGQCPAGQEEPPCNLCHLFTLLSRILNFLLVPSASNGGFAFVPLLAALLFAIGGFYFFTSAGNPERLARGRQVLFAVVIGALIVYGSWLFINFLLTALGVAGWTGLGTWWAIQCGTTPLLSLSASPTTIFVGESTTLLWEPQGVADCTASDGWSGSKQASCIPACSEAVTPPAVLGFHEYTLTCTGLGGKVEGTVLVEVDHRAPVVVAGPDQAIFFPGTATLDATVTDDGFPNPPGAFTTTWTRVSGSGSVTFGDPSAVNTTAAFSATDTYVLRLTASDGEKESFDELTIIVSNLPPIAGIVAAPLAGPGPMVSNFADVDPIVSGGGPITDWLWDFKDTTTSALQDPGPHVYIHGGTYAATLTVTGPGGTDTATETVVVDGVVEEMLVAISAYFSDMGFYPPDPGRGADPGFSKPLPFNDDPLAASGPYDCNIDFSHPACQAFAGQAHLPADWRSQVLAKWGGPYITEWPEQTFWGGEYDYNYWISGSVRYGCPVPQGIYIGVQGDYSDGNMLPSFVEDLLRTANYDDDGCTNGEAQVKFSNLPIAHWFFNELNAGRTIPGVGSGSSNGTFLGETFEDGAVTNAPLVAGKAGFGNALDFNGVDRYVEVPDSSRIDITSQITIGAWVNLRELTGQADVNMIVNKEGIPYEIAIHDNTGPDDGIHTCGPTGDLIPQQNFSFYLGGVSGLPSHSCGWIDGGGPVAKNTWTHVALTYDGSTAHTYVNGVLQKTYTGLSGAININTCNLSIGARGGCDPAPPPQANGGALFNGKIDEVRIYDRALTATQVGEDMNSRYPVVPAIASWSFENLVGPQTYDTHHIVQGKYEGAGNFEGIDDYVDLGASLTDKIENEGTILTWIYRKGISGGVFARSTGSGWPDERLVLYFRSVGAQWGWSIADGATFQQMDYPIATIPANQWTHLGLTWNGSLVTAYINGVVSDSKPQTVIPEITGVQTMFGRTEGLHAPYLNGLIDDIQLWDGALTPAQVFAEFTNGP